MSTKPLRVNCPNCLFSGSPCGIHRDTPPQPVDTKPESGEPGASEPSPKKEKTAVRPDALPHTKEVLGGGK